MKLTKLFLHLFLVSILITSCGKDTEDRYLKGDYDEGLLIVNKGNESTSGSISYLSYNLSFVENDIYKKINNQSLGDNVSSLGFYINEAMIVIKGENKLVSVDRYRFTEIETIHQHISSPSYFVSNELEGEEGKGYISNWGDEENSNDDYIAVMHMSTHIIVSKIPVVAKPEKMLIIDNKLFVIHGGENSNLLTVIDINTEKVIKEIELINGLNSMTSDVHGNVWLLASGDMNQDETAGELFVIDSNSLEIEKNFYFGNNTNHPQSITHYQNGLYYVLNNSIYKMLPSASTLPKDPIMLDVDVDMISVGINTIFGFQKNMESNSKVLIIDLDEKIASKEFSLGIESSNAYFNSYTE
ncbi:YncE family protein [Aureivirga sp. CE67]|uniref:YncE family protein n=1 Tax=Aureivirga sp. CE67 TaxID=1788983 RepID=UPI0018CBE707|nr:hypothetical protein [Aureivirga sp. CE67]